MFLKNHYININFINALYLFKKIKNLNFVKDTFTFLRIKFTFIEQFQ